LVQKKRAFDFGFEIKEAKNEDDIDGNEYLPTEVTYNPDENFEVD
jgi:hypothetical protein